MVTKKNMNARKRYEQKVNTLNLCFGDPKKHETHTPDKSLKLMGESNIKQLQIQNILKEDEYYNRSPTGHQGKTQIRTDRKLKDSQEISIPNSACQSRSASSR